MSTGISISSINQIKELAEEKRYAEALEVLDTQNLDKSINPQFLKISGEIFRKNKRYYDSRRILLKAHQMAPQGTRIISELILLYLELGYFSLANKYYEEYCFYVSQDDTQKDFVEYCVKKANGAEIRELASILIPILERMPEDEWNFEAVLLFDKMDRKDKALDESRFILENFKESTFTEKAIAYIDEKINVDEEFYIYPKEEQEEDTELFGDLIELEKSILEKDFLMMYPPEARIMVEVEDKDNPDVKPVKEKKEKKKKPKKEKKKDKNLESEIQEDSSSEDNKANNSIQSEEKKDSSVQLNSNEADSKVSLSKDEASSDSSKEKNSVTDTSDEKNVESENRENKGTDNSFDENGEETVPSMTEEELIKLEREEALDRLLAKKFDTDKIKESAKQIAESVKNIDTSKAKAQFNFVTENVKKASDALGEAVGTKAVLEETVVPEEDSNKEEFVDGIIESVLEPPKATVGQVVVNQELDSLIPDSIEAISDNEREELEARKEEQERLELEALEASIKLEEEKKKKKQSKKDDLDESNYSELRDKYIEEFMTEEEPVESLGFISVVHSDVDQTMEDDIPDTAQMLRQMIGNKEFYADENSLGFESEESYKNHGFEFESYIPNISNNFVYVKQSYNSDVYKVEDIYADFQVESFDDLAPTEVVPMEDYEVSEDWAPKKVEEEPVISVVNDGFEVEDFDVSGYDNVEDIISEVESFEETQESVTETYEEVVEPVAETYEEVVEPVAETYEEVEEPVAETYEEVQEPITETYEEVEESVAETYEEVEEPVAETYEEVEESVAETYETVEESVTETYETAEEPVAETYEEVEEPVAETYETVEESVTETYETVEVSVTETYETVEEPVAETYEEVQEPVTEIYEKTEEKKDFIIGDTFGVLEDPGEGEQFSFDMETPLEKAIKERRKLRNKILISEDMEKMLMALKETK